MRFTAAFLGLWLVIPLSSQVFTVGQPKNIDYSAKTSTRTMKIGTAAPSSGDCDAAGEEGRLYLQTGDPASVPGQTWVCRKAGASTYGWQPIGHLQGTAAPATCVVGQVFFDTDATAGANWFGCTSTDIWTPLSHLQNTDTGTTSTCFQVASGATGPKLCTDGSGGFSLKDASDNVILSCTTAGACTYYGTGSGETELKNQTGTLAAGSASGYTNTGINSSGDPVWRTYGGSEKTAAAASAVTASGGSGCTITAIVAGIITAATCAP
jgi:hypothetical protein